jgi:hypothetical protein
LKCWFCTDLFWNKVNNVWVFLVFFFNQIFVSQCLFVCTVCSQLPAKSLHWLWPNLVCISKALTGLDSFDMFHTSRPVVSDWGILRVLCSSRICYKNPDHALIELKFSILLTLADQSSVGMQNTCQHVRLIN